MKFIMVFGDGETYDGLEGCAILAVPDDADAEAIEELLDEERLHDTAVVATFDVTADGAIDIIESGHFRPLFENDGIVLDSACPPVSEGRPRARS